MPDTGQRIECTLKITPDLMGYYSYDPGLGHYVFFANQRRDVLDGIIGMTTAEWNARNPGKSNLDVTLALGETLHVVIDLQRRQSHFHAPAPFILVKAKAAWVVQVIE